MLTAADLLCILCHQSLSRVPSADSNKRSISRESDNGIELQPADVMALSSNVKQVSILTAKGKHDRAP